MKNSRGITLIALVITIIVLLILAGVSLSLVVGNNGVLTQASNAVITNREAKAKEEVELAWASAETEYWTEWAKDTSKSKAEIFESKMGDYLASTGELTYLLYVEDGTSIVKYKSNDNDIEYTFEIDSQGQARGISNSDILGGQTAEEENITYTDKNGETAVIPKGFTVSGFTDEQTIANGLVIYDLEGKEDTVTWSNSNKKTIQESYNQFVWIPCGTSGVKYEKENGLATTWRANYSGKQYYYTTINGITVSASDWTDNGGDSTSVSTNGGFYIGRYEAGVPEKDTEGNDVSFYANADGATYYTSGTTPSKNVTSYTPVSKRNNQSWNYISQTNAKTVSSNMYTGSDSVTSSLVDSYAWDTIVEWMNKSISGIATNSTNYGNYRDNTSITVTDTLYALHRYNESKATGYSSSWTPATKYKKGNITSGRVSITDSNKTEYEWSSYDTEEHYNYYVYKELATGATDKTKVKNIYDMGGNMWEWTTETGKHSGITGINENTEYAVRRGGSFYNGGSAYPVSYRHGNYSVGDTNLNIGFRVVVYIK